MIFDKEREQFELNADLIKNEAAINIRDILEDCANGRKTINLSVFSDDQLMDCLNASETLDSFLRNELSLKLKQNRPQADWYPEEYESIPVDVSYDDAVLRIFVPLTLRRINSKRNRIGVFVKHKMFAYEKENGIRFSKAIPHPLSILVIRHVKKVTVNTFDNNNNEDGAIINSLFEVFGYSDNPRYMRSYTNGVKEVGEDGITGVEFVVCPQSMAGTVIENSLNWD